MPQANRPIFPGNLLTQSGIPTSSALFTWALNVSKLLTFAIFAAERKTFSAVAVGSNGPGNASCPTAESGQGVVSVCDASTGDQYTGSFDGTVATNGYLTQTDTADLSSKTFLVTLQRGG